MRALIIEDDQKAARLIEKGLREERFSVDIAHSGDEGDEIASVTSYDVIVLNQLLPDKDGIVVCRGLRERGVVSPILMLSARGSLEDRVKGLNGGGPMTTSSSHSGSPNSWRGSARSFGGPSSHARLSSRSPILRWTRRATG